jgi:hypothetical protein
MISPARFDDGCQVPVKGGTFVFLETTTLRILSLYGYGIALRENVWVFHVRTETFVHLAFWEDMYVRVCFVIWNFHYDIPRRVLLLAADGLPIRSLPLD